VVLRAARRGQDTPGQHWGVKAVEAGYSALFLALETLSTRDWCGPGTRTSWACCSNSPSPIPRSHLDEIGYLPVSRRSSVAILSGCWCQVWQNLIDQQQSFLD